MSVIRRLLPTPETIGDPSPGAVTQGPAPEGPASEGSAAESSTTEGSAAEGSTARNAGREAVVLALADRYAYPDPLPAAGWVRANMISSLDGSATDSGGLSEGLGGPADQAVFSALRGLADVVLVGAATARAEDYTRLAPKPAFAQRRRAAGQSPAPALAVFSRSGEVPEPLRENDSRPGAGELIVLRGGPREAVAELAARGLRRVLFEGGPRALGQAVADGLVDELCLTLSPQLVAGDGPRIAHGERGAQQRLVLEELFECDGMLLGRWRVIRHSTPDAGRSPARTVP